MVYTKGVQAVEIIKEGGEDVLQLNYETIPHIPSIEDNAIVMMDALDKLAENPSAARLTFAQRRNYQYDYAQTQMLAEIAQIYNYFVRSKRATSLQNLGLTTDSPELLGERLNVVQYLLYTLLKQDPLGAYAELKRVARKETMRLEASKDPLQSQSLVVYTRLLQSILAELDKTKL
ncbi:MAG TPA: hypothetical protein VJJ79_03320, partial [Candidatus Nanoarchaeia archaeon]|nr:hypothetical protein [Candidatus Nanoarchaeia archaeon]